MDLCKNVFHHTIYSIQEAGTCTKSGPYSKLHYVSNRNINGHWTEIWFVLEIFWAFFQMLNYFCCPWIKFTLFIRIIYRLYTGELRLRKWLSSWFSVSCMNRLPAQGSFCVFAQPMGDDVTLQRRLSSAGRRWSLPDVVWWSIFKLVSDNKDNTLHPDVLCESKNPIYVPYQPLYWCIGVSFNILLCWTIS